MAPGAGYWPAFSKSNNLSLEARSTGEFIPRRFFSIQVGSCGEVEKKPEIKISPAPRCLDYTAAMRRYPLSFLVLTTLGALCAIPGIISLIGLGANIHPVLDDPMAGLAFIVSAIALIGSGAFPLVIEKLKEDENA